MLLASPRPASQWRLVNFRSISFIFMSKSSDSVGRLAEFYLGCVQEEGLRRLSIKGNRRNGVFIAPAFPREDFLHESRSELNLPRLHAKERAFLEEAAGDLGPQTTNQGRLFYGFPTYIDDRGEVSPLFFTELGAELDQNGNRRLVRREEGSVYVNHHLLRKEGHYPEQIADIQDQVERHSGSFREKLQAILEHLGQDSGAADWRTTRAFPQQLSAGIYPSPILFQSTYSSYTYNLERDLAALQKYGFLQREASSTAFGRFLGEGTNGARREPSQDLTEVIPLNDEQEEAVRAARQESLSVVTGPPGTGKSQVVVNLLADAVLSGRPVLFASKNNKAVDVVRERMRRILGEEFDVVLRLGSRRQMEEAKEELEGRLQRLSRRKNELQRQYTETAEQQHREKIDGIRGQIEELRERHREALEATDRRRRAEQDLPEEWTQPAPPDRPEVLNLRELRSALDQARALAGETSVGLILWLKRLLFASRLLESLRKETDQLTTALPPAIQEDVFARVYGAEGFAEVARTLELLCDYQTWIAKRQDEQHARARYRDVLNGASDFEERLGELKERLTDVYQELLRTVWVGRIARNVSDVQRRLRDYFESIQAVRDASRSGYKRALDRQQAALSALARYLPVWVVTNLSVRNALPLRSGLFDLVVIDEASQCDIASAVPLLFRANRSVVIGDPKQLQHITSLREDEEQRIARRSKATDLTPRWSYVRQSLYDVAERTLDRQGRQPLLLKRHYRSHPEIIAFSNDTFYGGELRGMRSPDSFEVPASWRGVRWFDVRGEVPPGIRSAYNEREVQAVEWILTRWYEDGLLGRADLSVGVVTPFRAQMKRIQRRLQQAAWWDELRQQLGTPSPVAVRGAVTIGTAHRFQGDERDLLIFSPVVAPGIRDYTAKWVAQSVPQLLNVSVTRARASLQVVGHLDYCRQAGGVLAPFADYVANRSLIQDKAARSA